MNKFKKTLATALACALIFGTGSKALADEANKTPSLFEILVSGENKTPSPEKKDDKETKPSYENDPVYQEEFKARYDLYNKILIAKDLREVDVTKFIDILNKKAAKNEDLEKVTEELSKQIDAADEKIDLDLDVEGVKKDVKAYILHGNLFFLDKLDKKDIKNLYLFYESTVNSYGLARAREAEKKAITPVLEDIYNYILEIDGKVKTGKEITEEDKTKTQDLIEKLAKALEENSKKDLSHQSTNLVKTSFLTSSNDVKGKLNTDSAFYKSQRPGIKEAYQNLSYNQREYLDKINQDNSDDISEEEIKAAGDYSLPLEGASKFIEPFLKSQDGNNVEVSSSEVAGQTNQTTSQPAQTPTTPQNPAGEVPETVTLSQGENTPGVKSEDAPTLLTKPASQVKTGIKGVGYLGIVLVVAIIAFMVLSKKKEDK